MDWLWKDWVFPIFTFRQRHLRGTLVTPMTDRRWSICKTNASLIMVVHDTLSVVNVQL